MKHTPHSSILASRHQFDPRAPRNTRRSPVTGHNFHAVTLTSGCGKPVKFEHPSFFRISDKYFAEEAQRGFAVDAALFSVLIATAVLPIINSAQAVGTLIHYVGLL